MVRAFAQLCDIDASGRSIVALKVHYLKKNIFFRRVKLFCELKYGLVYEYEYTGCQRATRLRTICLINNA